MRSDKGVRDMDRFWAILQWMILLLIILGVLRYYKGANTLLQTFLGWFFGESTLLAGFDPSGKVPNYAKGA